MVLGGSVIKYPHKSRIVQCLCEGCVFGVRQNISPVGTVFISQQVVFAK